MSKHNGKLDGVELEDYKTVLYRQEDGSWVAEVPAISGCYALMPTREEALRELSSVFQMLAEEYREKGSHQANRQLTTGN